MDVLENAPSKFAQLNTQETPQSVPHPSERTLGTKIKQGINRFIGRGGGQKNQAASPLSVNESIVTAAEAQGLQVDKKAASLGVIPPEERSASISSSWEEQSEQGAKRAAEVKNFDWSQRLQENATAALSEDNPDGVTTLINRSLNQETAVDSTLTPPFDPNYSSSEQAVNQTSIATASPPETPSLSNPLTPEKINNLPAYLQSGDTTNTNFPAYLRSEVTNPQEQAARQGIVGALDGRVSSLNAAATAETNNANNTPSATLAESSSAEPSAPLDREALNLEFFSDPDVINSLTSISEAGDEAERQHPDDMVGTLAAFETAEAAIWRKFIETNPDKAKKYAEVDPRLNKILQETPKVEPIPDSRYSDSFDMQQNIRAAGGASVTRTIRPQALVSPDSKPSVISAAEVSPIISPVISEETSSREESVTPNSRSIDNRKEVLTTSAATPVDPAETATGPTIKAEETEQNDEPANSGDQLTPALGGGGEAPPVKPPTDERPQPEEGPRKYQQLTAKWESLRDKWQDNPADIAKFNQIAQLLSNPNLDSVDQALVEQRYQELEQRIQELSSETSSPATEAAVVEPVDSVVEGTLNSEITEQQIQAAIAELEAKAKEKTQIILDRIRAEEAEPRGADIYFNEQITAWRELLAANPELARKIVGYQPGFTTDTTYKEIAQVSAKIDQVEAYRVKITEKISAEEARLGRPLSEDEVKTFTDSQWDSANPDFLFDQAIRYRYKEANTAFQRRRNRHVTSAAAVEPVSRPPGDGEASVGVATATEDTTSADTDTKPVTPAAAPVARPSTGAAAGPSAPLPTTEELVAAVPTPAATASESPAPRKRRSAAERAANPTPERLTPSQKQEAAFYLYEKLDKYGQLMKSDITRKALLAHPEVYINQQENSKMIITQEDLDAILESGLLLGAEGNNADAAKYFLNKDGSINQDKWDKAVYFAAVKLLRKQRGIPEPAGRAKKAKTPEAPAASPPPLPEPVSPGPEVAPPGDSDPTDSDEEDSDDDVSPVPATPAPTPAAAPIVPTEAAPAGPVTPPAAETAPVNPPAPATPAAAPATPPPTTTEARREYIFGRQDPVSTEADARTPLQKIQELNSGPYKVKLPDGTERELNRGPVFGPLEGVTYTGRAQLEQMAINFLMTREANGSGVRNLIRARLTGEDPTKAARSKFSMELATYIATLNSKLPANEKLNTEKFLATQGGAIRLAMEAIGVKDRLARGEKLPDTEFSSRGQEAAKRPNWFTRQLNNIARKIDELEQRSRPVTPTPTQPATPEAAPAQPTNTEVPLATLQTDAEKWNQLYSKFQNDPSKKALIDSLGAEDMQAVSALLEGTTDADTLTKARSAYAKLKPIFDQLEP